MVQSRSCWPARCAFANLDPLDSVRYRRPWCQTVGLDLVPALDVRSLIGGCVENVNEAEADVTECKEEVAIDPDSR
jgi:hypothetical protein